MCRMLLLCAAVVAVGQSGVAARASAAAKEPSQISSDCEQALAIWFIASYGVFAEPHWRALSETSAFAQLSDTLKDIEKAGCLTLNPQDPASCITLQQHMDRDVLAVHEQNEYQAYAQTEAYRAAQTGLEAVQEGECLASEELFQTEHALLP